MSTELSTIRKQISALAKPRVLLVLSGKRKCGKDYLEQLLNETYPDLIMSFRISAPIKGEFARRYNLDLDELLSASAYKENYRHKMVTWSEQIRAEDAHYFLRLALLESASKCCEQPRPIWILNDARRPTDLEYFQDTNEIEMETTKVITVRIHSTDGVRAQRGWIFTPGIDDQTTECGLDHHSHWHFRLDNNGDKQQLVHSLQPLLALINKHL